MNIIILPLYGIGDVLMTTPALKILKERHNDWNVTCLCMFRNTYDILNNNPHIDSLIYFPFLESNKAEALKFIFSLRGRFDCSINFYPSNRRQYNILAYLVGARKRIGHRYLHRDLLEYNFLKNRTVVEDIRLHNVEENVKLLEFLDIKPGNVPQMEMYLTQEEVKKGRDFFRENARVKIGIHAGTSAFKGHANRRWPKEHFVELRDSLDRYDFFLFGGKDDEEANNFIFENIKDKEQIFHVKGLTIREVAAVIKGLDLFVSNDSGLMHLAASVKVPVVAIFGPTNPDFVRPWGTQHENIRLDLDCSPCFYYSSRPLKCKTGGTFRCLGDISVNTVNHAIIDLISQVL